LSSAADPLTRTFQAKYVLEGPLADAPLGATVTVVLSDDVAASDVPVPLGALFDSGRGPGVWTILGEPARVTWRPIKLNRLDDETAFVSDGLKQGDRVVTLGAHALHEGQEVRVSTEAAGHDSPSGNAVKP
jgi:multidrug efflux pump subunit AcrA (membrane-fusion protein)